MNIVKVQSSAIEYVGYDEKSKIMLIKFLDKDIEYKFCRVPETVFKKLISAPSVGTYYHKHVEGKYLCPEFSKSSSSSFKISLLSIRQL